MMNNVPDFTKQILITGATGSVGIPLVHRLIDLGYSNIRVLTRNPCKAQEVLGAPVSCFLWDIEKGQIDPAATEGVDVVFHLAGKPIADKRWNETIKREILDSRVKGTQLLLESLKRQGKTPQKFISASAIGIYGDRGEEAIDEQSSLGDDFLAQVCKEWEQAAFNHNIESMDTHCIRIGLVLTRKGAALEKMAPIFSLGLGGTLGSGDQYMSWIHIDDLINQFLFLMDNEVKHKVYNGVTPRPVSNFIFTKLLGKQLKRPALFNVPAFILKAALGEISTLLLSGQKVLPTNFVEEGFQFKFKKLKDVFKDLLGEKSKGEYVLESRVWVPQELENVFKFFSDEKNLAVITPKDLNFKILNTSNKKDGRIQTGTVIDYSLNLNGIPFKWKTYIDLFKPNDLFIDSQRKGPYAKWVHTHRFLPFKEGTILCDRVVYKVPFGIIGRIFGGAFIRWKVKQIFKFRKKIIRDIFQKRKGSNKERSSQDEN